MGTKKGQVRKTARRAYKKKYSKYQRSKKMQKDIKGGNIDNITYYALTDRSPNFFNKLFRPFKFKGGKK